MSLASFTPMRSVPIVLGMLALGGCESALAEHSQAAPKPTIDPKADQLLRQMSKSLAATKSFRVDADHVLEVVTKEGEKLQFVAQSRVAIQRPNKVRSERLGPIADTTLYYDGKKLTIYGNRANLYASADAPPTIDGAIDFARDKLNLEAPAADLFYTDVYKGLMDGGVTSASYIGSEPIGDRICHHLAFRSKETDWQIWIEDAPRAMPCRYVITSKTEPGSPQFQVSLSNWKIPAGLDESEFTFKPPSGAERIEFLSQAKPQVSEATKLKKGEKP